MKETIQARRKALKMTQQNLADVVGVERSTVAKWENGTIPQLMKVKALACVFGCTVDDLIANRMPSGSEHNADDEDR